MNTTGKAVGENVGPGARKLIRLGHISGVHGVRGWVKIHSLTEPRAAIFDYQPWLLGEALKTVQYSQAKEHGKKLIALFENVASREDAEKLVHQEISVYRDELPETQDGQYYWDDLLGLNVELTDGRVLGAVQSLMATGANDVLVVRGEGTDGKDLLIPFVIGPYVKTVDIEGGRVVVDWDPDY